MKLLDIRKVETPPSWKKDSKPGEINFMLYDTEPAPADLVSILKFALEKEITNPRPLSGRILEYASVLHPRLYFSARKAGGSRKTRSFLRRIKAGTFPPPYQMLRDLDLTSEYYNSLLFLAGCTLSAAIIQNRYSAGTIESKLNRLWEFAHYYETKHGPVKEISDVKERIIAVGNDSSSGYPARLFQIKKMYTGIFGLLSRDSFVTGSKNISAEKLSPEESKKFGFVADLKKSLGDNLRCVFVYGSSVTSASFNDYDVIIVVENEDEAFKTLAGASPSYNGFDINLGVYSAAGFGAFQKYSGDNLDINTKCLYGSIDIPVKPKEILLLRNFSFAIIRLRQLLGMSAFLSGEGAHFGLTGNENIYHYFLKIPMHITKGVRSVFDERIDKEILNNWLTEHFGYSIDEQLSLCEQNRTWEAIGNSYVATLRVMDALNEDYNFIHF